MKNCLKSSKFWLLISSLIMIIVGFCLYFLTFNVFHYNQDRYVISLTIIAIWCVVLSILNMLLIKKPLNLDLFNLITPFALMIAMGKFLIPCLSPIGIYFTVNMGDMATYALGVPRCISGVAFYILAITLNVISSFFSIKEREVKCNEN